MTQARLCIQYSEIYPGKVLELSPEDRKYLFNVLRYRPGDTLIVFNGKGKSFQAEVNDLKTVKILQEQRINTEDSFSIILCQALLKGEKIDMIIEKATELGVKKIIPFVSSRCIVKSTEKVQRWKKIAKEASEQSCRSIVPEITSVTNFSELIKSIDNGILLWEKATSTLIQTISELKHDKPIFLLIGPEGGFSQEEASQAEKMNIKTASLGNRILRAETASIVSVALVSFLLQSKILDYS